MDDKQVREETVCCCCGRTIPPAAPRVVNNADYTKPRVFCRRCYLAAPWRDNAAGNGNGKGPEANGSGGKNNIRFGEG